MRNNFVIQSISFVFCWQIELSIILDKLVWTKRNGWLNVKDAQLKSMLI